MSTTRRRYAICVDNTGYEVSLIPRKLYEVIPDQKAAQDGLIRIIDESGEDYLYHVSHLVLVEFPIELERALTGAMPAKRGVLPAGEFAVLGANGGAHRSPSGALWYDCE